MELCFEGVVRRVDLAEFSLSPCWYDFAIGPATFQQTFGLGSVAVPALQARYWNFEISPTMTNAHIVGAFYGKKLNSGYLLYSLAITASVNSFVPAAPPTSRVRCLPSA